MLRADSGIALNSTINRNTEEDELVLHHAELASSRWAYCEVSLVVIKELFDRRYLDFVRLESK